MTGREFDALRDELPRRTAVEDARDYLASIPARQAKVEALAAYTYLHGLPNKHRQQIDLLQFLYDFLTLGSQ